MNKMNHIYFECDCSSADHIMRISHIPDEGFNDLLYVETHLRNLPFFKRFWLAIKYIFGFKSIYGNWEEYIWNKGNVIKMKEFCEEFLKEQKND